MCQKSNILYTPLQSPWLLWSVFKIITQNKMQLTNFFSMKQNHSRTWGLQNHYVHCTYTNFLWIFYNNFHKNASLLVFFETWYLRHYKVDEFFNSAKGRLCNFFVKWQWNGLCKGTCINHYGQLSEMGVAQKMSKSVYLHKVHFL